MHTAMRPRAAAGPEENRPIDRPRLYDLLILLLTRGRDRAYRERILDLASITPGARVLDIGCGTGTQALATARRCGPGGTVVGVDISAPMLDAARRKARRRGLDIAFRQADAAELPFPDGSFDVVTFTTVLHMVPEGRRARSLAEAARVLAPGGRLLLVDYAGERAARTHLSARHGAHGRFDLDALRDPVAEAGFQAIERGPMGWLGLAFLRARRIS
jgi:ubiquinone/menaquinone biosynthesis C-methylase UbiE